VRAPFGVSRGRTPVSLTMPAIVAILSLTAQFGRVIVGHVTHFLEKAAPTHD
jgi:hypothetical protein